MSAVTGTRKLVLVALLLAVDIGVVVVGAATHSAAPLFGAWVPLVGVAWVLARPLRDDPLRPASASR
jgi:hypothetical protein